MRASLNPDTSGSAPWERRSSSSNRRLSYTHKGTEKHFEKLGFVEGVRLAERVSGTSSFSHGAAYCMAVERMTGVEITEKAAAVRTLVLELERLYNHIGDIGNMCAGTALALGYMNGAVIKEQLMQLNERLTGSRYLRGRERDRRRHGGCLCPGR